MPKALGGTRGVFETPEMERRARVVVHTTAAGGTGHGAEHSTVLAPASRGPDGAGTASRPRRGRGAPSLSRRSLGGSAQGQLLPGPPGAVSKGREARGLGAHGSEDGGISDVSAVASSARGRWGHRLGQELHPCSFCRSQPRTHQGASRGCQGGRRASEHNRLGRTRALRLHCGRAAGPP